MRRYHSNPAINVTVLFLLASFSVFLPRTCHADLITVTTSAATGAGSLRDAITTANGTTVSDTISFAIPGTGPHVIEVSSSLPSINHPLFIDGFTQPGAAPATVSTPATILVELKKSDTGAGTGTGFRIYADSCHIRGMAVTSFETGIALIEGTGSLIRGNNIGLDASGQIERGNGVGILFNTQGHTIGGPDPASRNVISCNNDDGIRIQTGQWSDVPGLSSVIAGNFIGVDPSGTLDRGNGLRGIFIERSADNQIGGSDSSHGNIIAFNGTEGVYIAHGVRNSITANTIHDNGTLGIDLLWDYWDTEPDGINPNDVGDGDWGANELQNFPVLNAVDVQGGTTRITGVLNSVPDNEFRIDFFANTSTDFTTYGEGERFLGSHTVSTDQNGDAPFSVILPLEINPGEFVSSTATDEMNNTSEFSRCIVYQGGMTVMNVGDSGPGSLRNAITSANLNPGIDTIAFDLEGTGPYVISPSSMLPFISDPVIIDGYSQSGSSPAYGEEPAIIQIQIDGGDAGPGAHGLVILGGSSVVRGLSITGFAGYGIIVDLADSNVIEGNHVGLPPSGTTSVSNGWGVGIGFACGNRVGGLSPSARNVISGNTNDGISVYGDENRIIGNYIGIDATGTAAKGNGTGIQVTNSSIIGGTEPGASNFISGNHGTGIIVHGYDNLISNNIIGNPSLEITDLGNGGAGIRVGNGVNALSARWPIDQIGKMSSGRRYPGDVKTPPLPVRNNIGSNIISGNGELGIDLDPPGVNENDPDDSDAGANGGQNFPVIDRVTASGDSTIIVGYLESIPNSLFRIDIYMNSVPDASSYGEGQVFLGSETAITDASGHAYVYMCYQGSIPVGSFISCTATDTAGNTSEFGRAFAFGGDAIVTTVNDQGSGSLRQAILTANTSDLIGEITFAIPDTGSHIISILEPLPDIISPVIVNGYSQQGAVRASESQPAILQIILDGSLLESGCNGITVTADDCTINGLNIVGFPGSGIYVDHTEGVHIEGNWIGTVSGDSPYSGNESGIVIMDGNDNTIGGMTYGERNVISGNEDEGIRIEGESATDNSIIGNFVGLSVSGYAEAGNGTHGILLNGPENRIGGLSPEMRNVISGNVEHGICIDQGAASGNVILGNYIGTDFLGTSVVGNGNCGIWLRTQENTIGSYPNGGNIISGNITAGICLAYIGSRNNVIRGNHIGSDLSGTVSLGNQGPGIWVRGSSDNTIGGYGSGNIVAFNGGAGIDVQSGSRNLLSDNLCYSNGGLGIDLSPGGVTPNDEGDSDTGANGKQNFPELASAEFDSISTLRVAGELQSMSATSYTLQFFLSRTVDETGYGEGEIYVGEASVTSDGNGDASFVEEFQVLNLSGNYVISATATDDDNNTSEFCLSIPVQGVSACNPNPIVQNLELSWVPNPLITKSRFTVRIAEPSHTTVRIYNMNGERIRTVADDLLSSGYHTFVWDSTDDLGKRVSAGTYLYRVTGQGIDHSGKLILIR